QPAAARPVTELDRLGHFAFGQVYDIDAVGFFTADVEPFAVGAEHRVLGILAAHLDALRDRARRRVDQQHLVVFLDRRRQPLAVRREIDRLGRVAERRRGDDLTFAEIYRDERIGGLIADEQPRSIQRYRDPARFLREFERRGDAIGGSVNDRDRRGALVGHVRERRRRRGGGA